jgi:hypothetical protein
VLKAGIAGAVLGLGLWGLTFMPTFPTYQRLLIAFVAIGVVLLVISGLIGQLLAGAAIIWGLGFNSQDWKLDIVAMTAVAVLGAGIFRLADYGEVVDADDQDLSNFKQSLAVNVRAQIVFETVKWGIYGFTFSAVMILYTDNWSWIWAGIAGAFGVGTFFFGVLGAIYPVVATYTTLRLAERRLRLAESIPARVAKLKEIDLFLPSAENAALRFLHPKFVDELILMPQP